MSRGKAWRMPAKCDSCPFAENGSGLALRKSLRLARWREIVNGLRRGSDFHCHKTTDETGDGSNLLCAGALEWLDMRGLSTNYQRICERLDAIFAQQKQQAK